MGASVIYREPLADCVANQRPALCGAFCLVVCLLAEQALLLEFAAAECHWLCLFAPLQDDQ